MTHVPDTCPNCGASLAVVRDHHVHAISRGAIEAHEIPDHALFDTCKLAAEMQFFRDPFAFNNGTSKRMLSKLPVTFDEAFSGESDTNLLLAGCLPTGYKKTVREIAVTTAGGVVLSSLKLRIAYDDKPAIELEDLPCFARVPLEKPVVLHSLEAFRVHVEAVHEFEGRRARVESEPDSTCNVRVALIGPLLVPVSA